jgi:hypothetical protein
MARLNNNPAVASAQPTTTSRRHRTTTPAPSPRTTNTSATKRPSRKTTKDTPPTTFTMPGRVSTRRTTTSTGAGEARKSGARSTRSSGTAAVEIPDEGADNSLRAEISRAFAKAQHSTAVQRKVASDLRKVHEACCYEGVKPASLAQMWADFGEAEFNEEICRCVLRVLPVKKSEGVGDRTIRFLGVFLKFASEKGKLIEPQSIAHQKLTRS